MPKTYIITGDPSCSGTPSIYVQCSPNQIEAFAARSGFGCSQCRQYQEIGEMDMDEVDYVVTEKGNVFARMHTIQEEEKA